MKRRMSKACHRHDLGVSAVMDWNTCWVTESMEFPNCLSRARNSMEVWLAHGIVAILNFLPSKHLMLSQTLRHGDKKSIHKTPWILSFSPGNSMELSWNYFPKSEQIPCMTQMNCEIIVMMILLLWDLQQKYKSETLCFLHLIFSIPIDNDTRVSTWKGDI